MEKLSFIFLMCCVAIPVTAIHFLFPFDTASKGKIRQYLIVKGIVYLILVTVSITYDLIIKKSYSPSILLTICIALFEGTQILSQEVAKRRQADAEATMLAYQTQNDPFLKNVERLFNYCSAQLIFIKDAHETIDARQLAYEKVSDYLKYYYCANHFLDLFAKYVDGMGNLDDLDAVLQNLKVDIEMTVTEIVKIPEC